MEVVGVVGVVEVVGAAEDNDAGGSKAAADSVPLTHISPRGSPVPGWVGW